MDPLSLFNILGAIDEMAKQPLQDRQLGCDVVKNFTISTVLTADMGHETAIKDKTGKFFPVERYPSEEEALLGHSKWVDFIKNGNRNIVKLEYKGIEDSENITLK